MIFRPFSGFSLRIAIMFLLFVVIGSVALVLLLQTMAQRESDHVFTALARANAEFIKNTRLPLNERVTEPLGKVLNMRMFFRRDAGTLIPPASEPLASELFSLQPARGVTHLNENQEALAVAFEPGIDLLLVRPSERTLAFLSRPATLTVLAVFWLLSLALAWSVTHGIVRPLRLLASRLPHIEDDRDTSLPGAERDDEIGQVARAYLETRAQLASERERRIVAERLALLGRMATGLAHEIHNPLSAIRLHAQILSAARASELAAAQAESSPVLLAETERIENLVNQWMFLARPAPPQVSRAELGKLVADVIRTHTALARHAGVEIKNEIASELYADIDHRRITQAVSNIIVNAIQAMPDGGKLFITGSCEASLRLVFRDTGSGFSATAMRRYSELFFSEKEGGMGIGLSVSEEILKSHSGALFIENAPGGGAIVSIELPISNNMKPILIIEDEQALAATLGAICRRMGHEARLCFSGKRGLDAAARAEFALAILDIGLPDMSGLEVLKKLRARAAGLPVIIITAHGSLDNAVAARKLGAAAYLVKPLDLHEVQETLREALAAPHSLPAPQAAPLVAARRRRGGVAAQFRGDRARVRERCAGVDHRSDRHWKNAHRARHSCAWRATRRAVRRVALQRAAGDAFGKRTFRP